VCDIRVLVTVVTTSMIDQRGKKDDTLESTHQSIDADRLYPLVAFKNCG
jgi:hypothetical protein